MGSQEKAVKPPLIGEEVIPESLRLHSTILTPTAAKMARYQKFQLKNVVSRMAAISFVQSLSVPFAHVGSGDPVRVLHLLHNEYTG